MKEKPTEKAIEKVEKKGSKLSFLKETAALKKWFIATQILERKSYDGN